MSHVASLFILVIRASDAHSLRAAATLMIARIGTQKSYAGNM